MLSAGGKREMKIGVLALQGSFVRDMSAGRCFMALAALIFANWRAWPSMWACLLFGYLQAVGLRMQGVKLAGVEIPVQFINMLPYVLTVVLLGSATFLLVSVESFRRKPGENFREQTGGSGGLFFLAHFQIKSRQCILVVIVFLDGN